MGASTLYRAGALLLAAAILGVTICLTASNRDGGPGFSTPKTDRVITAFALTGEVTGFVLALAGAALIFLGIFDEGDLAKIVKAVWCFFALLALWFIAGALGNWALRRDTEIDNPRFALFDGRVKAEIGFLILSSIVWLIAIVLAITDPLSENSNGAQKVPSMALMALCFVLWVVILGLAASNRAGDGFHERVGPFHPERRTPPALAAFALTGCLLGLVFALVAIGLLVAGMWEPSDSPTPIIRAVWLFFAGVALWFTGLAVGVWAHRFIEGSDFNPARNQRLFAKDDTLWSSQWKAEFAFEIITSFFWIITICWFAAYGHNSEGIKHSDGGREKPAKKPEPVAAPPPAESRGLELQPVDDEARRRQEEEERRRREEEEARRRQQEEEERRRREEEERKAKEEAEFAAKRAAVPKKANPKGKKKKGEEGLFDESGQINEGTLRKLAPNLTEDEALMTIRKFQAMDKDGSGELTFDELLVLLNDLLKDKMGEQNIRRFAQMQFQVADQDKSGSLNIEEFLNIYSFIKEQAPKRAQAVDDTLANLAGRPGGGAAPKQPQSARGGKK